MLLSLGRVLGVEILSEWLSLESVGHVDTAFCDSTQRAKFLELLHVRPLDSSDHIMINASYMELFVIWLKERKVKVSCIYLCNKYLEMILEYVDLSALCSVHFENIWKDSVPLLITLIKRVSTTLKELHLSESHHFTQELFDAVDQCELLELVKMKQVDCTGESENLVGHLIRQRVFGKEALLLESKPSLDFSKFKNLRVLSLQWAKVTTSEALVTSLINGCPELTHLEAHFTIGNVAMLKLLDACSKLTSVETTTNMDMPYEEFLELASHNLRRMKTWNVRYDYAEKEGADYSTMVLNHMPNLTSMVLQGSADLLTKVCASCPYLTALKLSSREQSPSTDSMVLVLSQLKHLRKVSSSLCYHMNKAAAWKCLFDRFETVTKVDVFQGVIEGTYNPDTPYCHIPTDTDDLDAVLVNGMRKYSTLDYCGVNVISQFSAFIHCAPSITVLNLKYTVGMQFADIAPVLNRCNTALREITLPEAAKITDKDLAPFIARCGAELTRFEVNMNRSVSDKTLRALAEHCPKLEHLTVRKCYKLTTEGFCAVAAKCRRLRILDVTDCKGFTSGCIEALVHHCPALHILYLQRCGSGGMDESLVKEAKNKFFDH